MFLFISVVATFFHGSALTETYDGTILFYICCGEDIARDADKVPLGNKRALEKFHGGVKYLLHPGTH